MLTPVVAALAVYSIEVGIVYSRPGPGVELAMDVYRPRSKPLFTPPALLVIHGGGWMSGKREEMGALARRLAGEGFVAATPSYRLAPNHKWPAMLDDVQTAVRYLRANSKSLEIDPTRIGAVGASAGGHLALLLGYRDTRIAKPAEYPGHSSKVSVVLDLFGPTDFNNDFHPAFEALVPMFLGKAKADAKEDILEMSPITHVTPDDAPTFIFHGTADRLVPVRQSERLEERLHKAGVPYETAYIEDLGHEVDIEKPGVFEAFQRMLEWLRKHLGPKA